MTTKPDPMDAECPVCTRPLGVHTMREYDDCVKQIPGVHLPYQEIPGGPMLSPAGDSIMAGEFDCYSAAIESPLGWFPVLRFVFKTPGLEPQAKVPLPPIDLILDGDSMRHAAKVISDCAEKSIDAAAHQGTQ